MIKWHYCGWFGIVVGYILPVRIYENNIIYFHPLPLQYKLHSLLGTKRKVYDGYL